MDKSPDAFRTISEVADWLDVPTHVLRFWESRFSQVKPVKRAGGRRYYRPNDMLLIGGIKKLLHDDGMTIRAVQKLLREEGVKHVSEFSQSLDGNDETLEVPFDVSHAASDDDAVVALPKDRPKAPIEPAIEDAELVEADHNAEQTAEQGVLSFGTSRVTQVVDSPKRDERSPRTPAIPETPDVPESDPADDDDAHTKGPGLVARLITRERVVGDISQNAVESIARRLRSIRERT